MTSVNGYNSRGAGGVGGTGGAGDVDNDYDNDNDNDGSLVVTVHGGDRNSGSDGWGQIDLDAPVRIRDPGGSFLRAQKEFLKLQLLLLQEEGRRVIDLEQEMKSEAIGIEKSAKSAADAGFEQGSSAADAEMVGGGIGLGLTILGAGAAGVSAYKGVKAGKVAQGLEVGKSRLNNRINAHQAGIDAKQQHLERLGGNIEKIDTRTANAQKARMETLKRQRDEDASDAAASEKRAKTLRNVQDQRKVEQAQRQANGQIDAAEDVRVHRTDQLIQRYEGQAGQKRQRVAEADHEIAGLENAAKRRHLQRDIENDQKTLDSIKRNDQLALDSQQRVHDQNVASSGRYTSLVQMDNVISQSASSIASGAEKAEAAEHGKDQAYKEAETNLKRNKREQDELNRGYHDRRFGGIYDTAVSLTTTGREGARTLVEAERVIYQNV